MAYSRRGAMTGNTVIAPLHKPEFKGNGHTLAYCCLVVQGSHVV